MSQRSIWVLVLAYRKNKNIWYVDTVVEQKRLIRRTAQLGLRWRATPVSSLD